MPSETTRRRVLRGVGIATAAGLAGCSGLDESPYSPGTDEGTDWPMPGYDRGSTAYAPDAAGPTGGVAERWAVEIPGPLARPVVAGGVVLVTTFDGLAALDVRTGERLWQFGNDDVRPASPTVVRDGVAVVGTDGEEAAGLLALDVADGTEVWSAATRGTVRAAPAFSHDESVLYAGDDTGRIYSVETADGSVSPAFEVFGVVTTLAHRRSLLVGTEGGEVYELFGGGDGLRGQWRRKLAGPVVDVATVGDTVVVATFGGPVYRLEGSLTGANRWVFDGGASSGVVVAPNHVVAADGGGLGVLDLRTGDSRWSRDRSYPCAPAAAGDTLYAGVGELGEEGRGHVAAYRLSGGGGLLGPGRRRWRFDLDSAPIEGLAVADGAVVAVTQGREGAPPRTLALESGRPAE